KLADWAGTSQVGTRASLDFEPHAEAWAAVRAERGNCLQQRSPFFETCVWQRAKRRARDSGVLVVNHALLLEDLKVKRGGGSVLPPYSILIVDEAHHLEEVAAEHLGRRVARGAVLAHLRTVARLAGATSDRTLAAQVARCRGGAVELFDSLGRWLGARPCAR